VTAPIYKDDHLIRESKKDIEADEFDAKTKNLTHSVKVQVHGLSEVD